MTITKNTQLEQTGIKHTDLTVKALLEDNAKLLECNRRLNLRIQMLEEALYKVSNNIKNEKD